MWYDEAVVYQIYPLGLCGAPLQNSGDQTQAGEHRLLRVLDWVEHIKKLGATCVLFNPLFESDAHGYDTRDYLQVDCRLGTREDLQQVCGSFHQAGQLQREARTRYDGIHTCLHSSANGVGVVLGGDHRVDSHQSRAVGDLFRFGDFFFQRTEIRCERVAGKIGFSVACVGGGDAPHAAAGRDRTGQPAEGDAHAHAAL